jgi:predicted permease
VALISESLWRRRFSADASILGRTLNLNGSAYTVVGVLPAGFQFPFRSPSGSGEDVALPLGQSAAEPIMRDRAFHAGIFIVGRLKLGVSTQTARADFGRIAQALAKEYPKENAGHGISVTPLRDMLVENVRNTLYLLMGSVGFVLLIACANVANLLLARATVRAPEIAMRAALGATRSRIVRQLLTESSLLALAGGVTGVMLASVCTSLLSKSAARFLPRADQVNMDSHVLLFTLATAVLTGFLFGLVPAMQFSRTEVRGAARGVLTGRHGFRDAFVVAQLALAVPLLIGGALMIRTLWNLHEVDPGFDPHHMLALNVTLSPAAISSGPSIRTAYRELLGRLQRIPGVEAATVAGNVPMTGDDMAAPIRVEGRPIPRTQSDSQIALLYPTTPDYLRATGIRLLRGRFIDDHDNVNSRLVMVLDEVAARTLFPNDDAIGKRVVVGTGLPMEIVGIVGHVKHSGLDDDVTARFHLQAYYPVQQLSDEFLKFVATTIVMFVVRTRQNPVELGNAIRAEIRKADPDDVMSNIEPMDQVVSGTLASRRFLLTLLGAFAGIALVLASVGIYGVISYSVSQRTREIGVRMALGARPGDILRSVLGRGAILAATGISVGVVGGVFLTRFMSGMLFGVAGTDPKTFIGVAVVLGVVAIGAGFLPALRGSRADPLTALRCE